MIIATKKGDNGTSSLLSGERLPKSHIVFEVVGDIDELNVSLGGFKKRLNEEDADFINSVQKNLIDIMGEIVHNNVGEYIEKFGGLGENNLQNLDFAVDTLQKNFFQKGWILYDGGELSNRIHMSSKICRRAERHLVSFSEGRGVRQILLTYMNRLSDYLFLIGKKYEEFE